MKESIQVASTSKIRRVFVKEERRCLKHRCRFDTDLKHIDIGLTFETREIFSFKKCLLLGIETPVLDIAMDYFFKHSFNINTKKALKFGKD